MNKAFILLDRIKELHCIFYHCISSEKKKNIFNGKRDNVDVHYIDVFFSPPLQSWSGQPCLAETYGV